MNKMWAFKDQARKDYSAFLNFKEFATYVDVDGVKMPGVIDQDLINEKSNLQVDFFDGAYSKRLTLYVKYADLGYVPNTKNAIDIDGERYEVVNASVAGGIVTINVGAIDG